MWLRHWQLSTDPFPSQGGFYVPTPAHERAIAGILSEVEAKVAVLGLTGTEGSGRRMLAREMVGRLRTPTRRGLILPDPFESPLCLLRTMGRPGLSKKTSDSWDRFGDLMRVLRLEGMSLVGFVVSHETSEPIDRLINLSRAAGGTLTLVLMSEEPQANDDRSVKLRSLTRTEASEYLSAKLSKAGRDQPTFDTQAFARLHAEASGNLGRLDRLARRALVLAAQRGEWRVSVESAQQVAREAGPAGWYERRRVG